MVVLMRTTHFREDRANEYLSQDLDVMKERHKWSNICQEAYKKAIKDYYNKKVKEKALKVGDYVLRKNEVSHALPRGKLGAKWEGPYKVVEAYRKSKQFLFPGNTIRNGHSKNMVCPKSQAFFSFREKIKKPMVKDKHRLGFHVTRLRRDN